MRFSIATIGAYESWLGHHTSWLLWPRPGALCDMTLEPQEKGVVSNCVRLIGSTIHDGDTDKMPL